MDHIEYLFAGFAVFWSALFIYLLTLQARIRSLHREIEQLEERLAETEGSPRTVRDAGPGHPSAAPRTNA
ncbi:MAG: CcmD family protein [Dehalococcoidia bacterium]